MTLTSSSRKPFLGLFLQSLKISVWIPLVFFIQKCVHTFSHSASDYSAHYIGFFWNDSTDDIFELFTVLPTILSGFVMALFLFYFALNKKQNNVIFSLGMTKTEIFTAKMLAGIVPFAVAVLLAAGLEIFACVGVGYKLSARYLLGAVYLMLNTMIPYIFTFSVSASVLANCANVIEGSIFTFIIFAAPSAFRSFVCKLLSGYTLGVSSDTIDRIMDHYTDDTVSTFWNWVTPFFNTSTLVFDDYYDYGEVSTFFSVRSNLEITVFDWSSVIMAAVYSMIAIAVGLAFFRKRRNEITGTFGRTKGLAEICAVVTGIYLFGKFNLTFPWGEANVTDFLFCLCGFVVGYLVFKLIFSSKRKKEMVRSLKRLCVYSVAVSLCCVMFYINGFGFASYIPDIDDINYVYVTTPVLANLDDRLSGGTEFGMKPMNIRNEVDEKYEEYFGYYNSYSGYIDFYEESENEDYELYDNTSICFSSKDDIEKVAEFHKAIIDDGHVKKHGTDTQGVSVIIEYRLKNGARVIRNYFRSTEDTVQKLLLLSDCEASKSTVDLYFNDYYGTYDFSVNYDNVLRRFDKALNLRYCSCYLFSLDMAKGYSIGCADEELFNALKKDVLNQSAQEYYNHSPEDEIGILSFSSAAIEETYKSLSEELSLKLGDNYATDEWSLNPVTSKVFVLTKDMVNTIKYLEDHNLMKYFTNYRTVEDISYVRLATLGELYGETDKHLNIPIFYGAYSINSADFADMYDDYYFGKIEEKITDKAEIQALLDEAVVFGYCANNSKIMEITYNDGCMATMMVRAE